MLLQAYMGDVRCVTLGRLQGSIGRGRGHVTHWRLPQHSLALQLSLKLLAEQLPLGNWRLLSVDCWLVGSVNSHHATHPRRQHPTVGGPTLHQLSQRHAYWSV